MIQIIVTELFGIESDFFREGLLDDHGRLGKLLQLLLNIGGYPLLVEDVGLFVVLEDQMLAEHREGDTFFVGSQRNLREDV